MDIEISKRSFNLALADANKQFEDLERFLMNHLLIADDRIKSIESYSCVQRIVSEILSLKEFFDEAVEAKNELCIDSCLTNLSELCKRMQIAVTECYSSIRYSN